MKITEVRIFPTESRDGKLKAFATMTFDDWFVVRNVKVIQGNSGLFVAMPSRKAMDSCPKCRFKNARGSRYCNECGSALAKPAPEEDASKKKQEEHMDIAHPITQDCRVYIQDQILVAYENEAGKKQAEGSSYNPPADEMVDSESGSSGKEESKQQESSEPEIADVGDGKDIEL
jgi:stage V sporulation protein G